MPVAIRYTLIAIPVLAVLYLLLAYLGAYGRLETAGQVSETPRPATVAEATREAQAAAAASLSRPQDSQILFGDLHAHTTYSIDAFQYSLGMMGGYGSHPPADACDFARYCSALDFFSINDHAEHLTPAHWKDTRESIRACNAVAGDPANPDMVAFLGFEWTHAGTVAANHYGHKNVVFRDTEEGQREDYQFMIESYSGHGNSEEYRDWRAIETGADGEVSCPAPTAGYLPSCWRAGEIIGERCLDNGGSAPECELRSKRARQLYASNGVAGHNVIGGVKFEEWLDAGQCRDCFLPAFNYRPGGSAQYALSVTNFDNPEQAKRFNFAMMASSDNHVARPGTGYKEYDRYGSTETSGVQKDFARKLACPRSKYSDLPREGDFMRLQDDTG